MYQIFFRHKKAKQNTYHKTVHFTIVRYENNKLFRNSIAIKIICTSCIFEIKKPILTLLFLASAVEVKGDEFWDYDQQVDLEGFSAPTLYATLATQSKNVTQTLGKQKDEVTALPPVF